ncbi:glutamyl-tRNA{Gln} amidotransferase subunit E [Geoglobus ahangari]|uniref:Glutamyl-tRNA(Gln) amidotransferase subunit E n=1 Tax=Geoglobus ahangari TaxID=113653 RepID=A0A0F7IEU8_9EURY|nr:Glu-tRNA(Gln) amidotransferase subunit GatE [Geoglobus ahangari]AKG91210.1 glutamyl-tRNA{Gln} amidotransferase subunit E [Geoglobus ahangari]
MNYADLGLKVGIEIHQQLDTKHKLFCRCPTELREVEDSNFEFFRYLRLKRSELGTEDRAAKEEVMRSRRFTYKFYDTTCLVEADEEPPTEINREALIIGIQIAKMLNMELVDELHVMRKIVIDGSNTTGFQRTALLAFDGYLEVDGRRIGVATLCIEEEAAKKVEERRGEVVYSLDRLGIPLVEIGTEPDINSPEMAKKVAKKLGMILRSTGKVKRGLGTIRQDVNISIEQGARVEIKGVQDVDILDKIVEYEVVRQVNLLRIRDELRKRNARVCEEIFDVKDVFASTKSKILRKAKAIMAVKLEGFSGLVGMEIQPGRRLGTEFADIAKTFGLGGIFHTDELPAYGISEQEVEELRKAVNAGEGDAVIIAAGDEQRVRNALARIVERAKFCLVGVPEETRKANDDGTTSYLRPLPGAARMYPETDVPPVVIDEEMRGVEVPELIEERAERYMRSYGLSEDLAMIMADPRYSGIFEEFAGSVEASVVARVLHIIPSQLRKEGYDVDRLGEEDFRLTLSMIRDGKIAKEGAEEVLKILSREKVGEEEILARLSPSKDLDGFIADLVKEKSDLIAERGENAFKPLMGLVMKEFRGKVDGKVIAEKLREAIKRELENI